MAFTSNFPEDTPKEQILEHVMIEHGDDLLRLAYSYVKRREIAEELVQEVFIKFFSHIDSFRGESTLKTWLYRITVNQCKDYLKSWHHKKVLVSDFIPYLTTKEDSTLEEDLIGKDKENEVLKVVLSLPISLREVIFLFYYEELKIEEISHLLKINGNTVKSRLFRARKNLKKKFLDGGVTIE